MARKTDPTRLRNVSPLGALDVPALGRIIAAGEVFETSEEIAEALTAQAEHFEPTTDPSGIPASDDTDTEGTTDDDAA